MRRRLVALGVALAAVLAGIALVAVWSSSPADPVVTTTVVRPRAADGSVAAGDDDIAEAWADGVVDGRDGVVPDDVTVFDDAYPGVANLDPDLLRAVRAAATAAADDGIAFYVHSAWRSPEYQAQLLGDAVAEHGSEGEAARWVARPDRSLHVSGDAIDIGGDEAREWVADHGAAFGLCRVYENEPWHVELRPAAVDEGCPAPYADPTEDPRLQP